MHDPALQSWYYTLPDIGFSVPDWIRIDRGQYKSADHGRQGRVYDEKFIGKVPAKMPCLVYCDGEIHRFPSVNRAETEGFISTSTGSRQALSVNGVIRRRNGTIIWIEGRDTPEEIKEAYEAWRMKNAL